MTKLAPQEKAITEWLASQKEAMLGVAAPRSSTSTAAATTRPASTPSASASSASSTEQGLLTSREPNDRFGDAIHIRLDDKPTNEQPDRADGSPRHGVPQGRGRPPPIPHRERPRLRSGRRRHEVGARHQRLRAGRLQALRRRAGAARRPHHQRRGDRLARRRGPSSSGWRGRRVACSTPSPAGPPATSSRGARAACSSPSRSPARRRTRAATSRRASAPSASWRTRSSPCTR